MKEATYMILLSPNGPLDLKYLPGRKKVKLPPRLFPMLQIKEDDKLGIFLNFPIRSS
jgi:hypothetical protein